MIRSVSRKVRTAKSVEREQYSIHFSLPVTLSPAQAPCVAVIPSYSLLKILVWLCSLPIPCSSSLCGCVPFLLPSLAPCVAVFPSFSLLKLLSVGELFWQILSMIFGLCLVRKLSLNQPCRNASNRLAFNIIQASGIILVHGSQKSKTFREAAIRKAFGIKVRQGSTLSYLL